MKDQRYILLVDDDPQVLSSFSSLLEERGYVVDSARNGKEAIEDARSNIYDLLVLDLKLPDVEGVELMRKMQESLPGAKKIILTGYPTLDSAMRAIGIGTDAYLLKPIEPTEFLDLVEQKIREKDEEDAMTEEKVHGWIKLRDARLTQDNARLSGSSKWTKLGTEDEKNLGSFEPREKLKTSVNASRPRRQTARAT